MNHETLNHIGLLMIVHELFFILEEQNNKKNLCDERSTARLQSVGLERDVSSLGHLLHLWKSKFPAPVLGGLLLPVTPLP